MLRAFVLLLTALLALSPGRAVAGSAYGSPTYGDPPGWCTHHSDMWTAAVYGNDPLVAANPERNTFFGFHPDPGYDDWYGYFYGDFRGVAGDQSGWVTLLHEVYPDHYSWNFADSGWAVHGHVKQYIAYYNWTFGGECGIGHFGGMSSPPYMADQYGWPVVDIYVDAVAPFPPTPRVVSTAPTSVAFTWDPVADRGDGAGQDFYEAGMDHYESWVSIDGGPPLQLMSTTSPRTISQTLLPGHTACVHVRAVDRVGNATPDEVACAQALGSPPMPVWGPLASAVTANPAPVGLVGLDTWFWLSPALSPVTVMEAYAGVDYRITAIPIGATWDFGDGGNTSFVGPTGFGVAFPARSGVTHTYQAHDQAGYAVRAAVTFDVEWSADVNGAWVGPYPMGSIVRSAQPLVYPVQQAQPEVLSVTGSL